LDFPWYKKPIATIQNIRAKILAKQHEMDSLFQKKQQGCNESLVKHKLFLYVKTRLK